MWASSVSLLAQAAHSAQRTSSPSLSKRSRRCLVPFPAPGVVVLDNAPGHRALTQQAQTRILTAVQRRGSLLIWNPPHSPDLNPIEHLWQVTNTLCEMGQLGIRRPFVHADLMHCLQNARLSREAYRSIFRQPI